MARLEISRAGLELIESFEGFRAKAVRLQNGKFTVGFGHVATAREGMVVTRDQAEELLLWDLGPIQDYLRQYCLTPLNQNQFDALASLVFNIGIENFKTSEVLRHLNQGEIISAAIAISAWRRAHINQHQIVVDALVRRRTLEAAMFLDTIGARPAVPTPIIEPLLDYSASLLAPKPQTIREVTFEKSDPAPKIADINLPVLEENKVAQEDDASDLETRQKDEIIADLLVDEAQSPVASAEILPFPQSASAPTGVIELSKTADGKTIANEIALPEAPIANDEKFIRNNIAAANEQEVKSTIISSKTKNIIDPFTVVVVVIGLIAFGSAMFEAVRQSLFTQGIEAIKNNPSAIFIMLTIIIGAVTTAFGVFALFDNGEESAQ